MKFRLLSFLLPILTGCTSLGDIEALNDANLSQLGETLRVFRKVEILSGRPKPPNPVLSTQQFNIFYGNINHFHQLNDVSDIPYIFSDIQNL